MALIHAMLQTQKYYALCQVLQYHIPIDSTELAEELVKHTSLRQLGLDMYARMGAVVSLVHTLLRYDEVRSCRINGV